mgnify:CR=1 FL=1
MKNFKTGALSLFAVFVIATGLCAESDRKPNVVLVYADDLGIGDVSAYFEGGEIPTPHIDRLAEEGIRFTDAHVAASVCAPSRFALLTGTFSWRYADEGYKLYRSGLFTMADLFRGAGYRTAMFGKWHLGSASRIAREGGGKHVWPERVEGMAGDAGFDVSVILPWGHQFPPCAFIRDDVFENYDPEDPITAEPIDGEWKMTGGLAARVPPTEVAERLQREALDFIRRNAERPFFVYYAVPQVHDPYVPRPEFRGATKIGAYGDYVVELDEAVGELVRTLKETGAWENTLLVFTSDNGATIRRALPAEVRGNHSPNGPYRGGKGSLYEGGIRVPFIAVWPGHIPENTVSDEPISTTDLMATFSAMLGADLPPGAARDSYDILPILLGGSDASSKRIYVYESAKGKLALRSGPWKLIDGPGGGGFNKAVPGAPEVQLYNVRKDPYETTNLQANDPERVRSLRELLTKIAFE